VGSQANENDFARWESLAAEARATVKRARSRIEQTHEMIDRSLTNAEDMNRMTRRIKETAQRVRAARKQGRGQARQ
jgi:hypothetical protein